MTDDAAGNGEGQGEAVVRAREEVIEAMERTADIYGVKRSYGRLYGILFFAEEPLSLDELVAESDYAKSTVSTAMGALEQFYLVQRRSIPGEGKKAFYEAERDFWYVSVQLLDDHLRREVRIMKRALDDAAERLEEAEGGETELERIEDLRRTYGRVERVLNFVTGLSLDRLGALIDRVAGHSDDGR